MNSRQSPFRRTIRSFFSTTSKSLPRNHRFASHLFSVGYKSPFQQPLCFRILPKRPRALPFFLALPPKALSVISQQLLPFQELAASLASLCAKIDPRFLCFQQFTDTFLQIRGVGARIMVNCPRKPSPSRPGTPGSHRRDLFVPGPTGE